MKPSNLHTPLNKPPVIVQSPASPFTKAFWFQIIYSLPALCAFFDCFKAVWLEVLLWFSGMLTNQGKTHDLSILFVAAGQCISVFLKSCHTAEKETYNKKVLHPDQEPISMHLYKWSQSNIVFHPVCRVKKKNLFSSLYPTPDLNLGESLTHSAKTGITPKHWVASSSDVLFT